MIPAAGGRVLVIGDLIDDLIVRPHGPIRSDTDTPSTIERRAGGSAANTACWIAAAGGRATLVATVGADDLERHATALAALGVRAELTGVAAATGAIIVISDGSTRTMLTDRGANALTGPERISAALLAEHAHLHLTGHAFTGPDRDTGWRELLDAAQAAGLTRSVSPGSAALLEAYGAERFRRLVTGVEVLIPSLDEALLLTGAVDAESAARALAAEHEVVVITLGASGALAAAGDVLTAVEAIPATAIDVTGAGDAFAGGLLAAWLGGADAAEAMSRGAALAARAVGIVGARPA